MSKNRRTGNTKHTLFAAISIFVAIGAASASTGEEQDQIQPEISLDMLEQLCEGFDDPLVVLSEECRSKLDQYFHKRPVWEESTMSLFGGRNSVPLRSLINPRSRYLKFDGADYNDGDYPLWSDIFDDGLKSRHNVVAGVFDDEVCRGIHASGAIDPNLAQRCHAQELAKYAIYIDACLSGFHRDDELSRPQGRDVQETGYGRSLRMFGRLGQDIEALTRSALHTAWIVGKCQPPFFYPVNSSLKAIEWGSEEGLNILEFAKSMKLAYSAAAGISARSGNKWAAKLYYPPSPHQDSEYWNSLYETDPVLVHRFMASARGFAVLTEEEQAWHAVSAYELLRKEGVEIDSDISAYIGSLGIRDVSEEVMDSIHAYLEGGVEQGRLADRVKLPW